jgi:hypothetical protein
MSMSFASALIVANTALSVNLRQVEVEKYEVRSGCIGVRWLPAKEVQRFFAIFDRDDPTCFFSGTADSKTTKL